MCWRGACNYYAIKYQNWLWPKPKEQQRHRYRFSIYLVECLCWCLDIVTIFLHPLATIDWIKSQFDREMSIEIGVGSKNAALFNESLLTKNESKLIKLPDDNGWYNKLQHFTGYYQIFPIWQVLALSLQWFNTDSLFRCKHFDWKITRKKGQPQFTANLSIEKTIYLLLCAIKMWLL